MTQFDCLITNGSVEMEDLTSRKKDNWNVVCVVPASIIESKAMETDLAIIFSRTV